MRGRIRLATVLAELWTRRKVTPVEAVEATPGITAAAVTEGERKPAAPGRRRRRGLGVLLVAGCLVGPWLMTWPWQQTRDEMPTSDPSSIVKLAHSQAVTGRAPSAQLAPPPSELSVREVASTARDGYDTPVSAAAASRVKTRPGPYEPLGRVVIPRIGLTTGYGEGVYAKTLLRGAGHWPGTPLPGEDGNSVLSGHRNTHTAPFRYLNLLRHGDKVLVSVSGRAAVTFRVDRTTIVREAKFKDFVLQQPKDPNARVVTLFACHPEGNPVYRIVVRATA